MKVICKLKVNKTSTAKLELDFDPKEHFTKAALETKLKEHPWFYKNKDRLTIHPVTSTAFRFK